MEYSFYSFFFFFFLTHTQSGKWDLMDCLNEDGTISQNKRRKQLRDIKRKKKNGGNDGDASPRSENGY